MNWDKLEITGWATTECPLNENLNTFLIDIGRKLGIFLAGRKGTVIQRLQPVDNNKAYPQSLSKLYGLSALPLHNDTAHLPTPCRYIILGCEEPGQILSPTILLDTYDLDVTQEEAYYINSALFFVENGKKSFYSTIRRKDKPFFRFDPGCMEPISSDSEKVIKALDRDRQCNKLREILWIKNRVLIIDNWRMLHGRDNKQPADPQRSLLRIMIK